MADNPLSAFGAAGKKLGGVIGDFAAHLREGKGEELGSKFAAVRDQLLDSRNTEDLKEVGPKLEDLLSGLKQRVREAADDTETADAKAAWNEAGEALRELLDRAAARIPEGAALNGLRARLDDILSADTEPSGRHARQEPEPEIIDGEIVGEDPSVDSAR